ncbi:unnamed protein product [Dibothriocephalus latus]|uniref:Uncharacterized protein n=1 Tax=Dibothriocephalus latus TaxID=60516 RepID=A0A3P7QN56_DIBLA|nr:unnamed protein product [Dibothriocephalus latus]
MSTHPSVSLLALLVAKPPKPDQPDSALQLETLLEDHKRCLQQLGTAPRPPHLYTKDVRLMAIINAVEAEQGQSDKRRKKEPATATAKADKLRNLSIQRKPARKRQHQQPTAGAQRGKHVASRCVFHLFANSVIYFLFVLS